MSNFNKSTLIYCFLTLFFPAIFASQPKDVNIQSINTPVYKDVKKSTEERVNDICRLMTLEEKADFLTGVDSYHFKGIERLGIPSIQLTNCGHGVTLIFDKKGNWVGNATCFPTAVGQAATWNRPLIREMGSALGREVRATGSSILLSPMVNIVRQPLNGRNYETFSEDPILTGEMATAFIQGVQSENIGAVIKHIAANNQQVNQEDLTVKMDERTLQEIYLPAFRIAIHKSNPWGVMTAYNGLNDAHTSENKHLLQEILKKDWKYNGFVTSDWRAIKSIEAITSGLDLEMPGPGKIMTKSNILKAIDGKRLTITELDDKVKRILRALVKSKLLDAVIPKLNSELNSEKHKELARRVSEEGIVLLKNKSNILPFDLSKIKSIAVIGPNAIMARLGGGGSATVSPFYTVSPIAGLRNFCGKNTKIVFEEGCGMNGSLKVVESNYFRNTLNGRVSNGLKSEYFKNDSLEGIAAVTKIDEQVDFSWGWANPVAELGKWGYSVRWTGQLLPPVTGEYKLGITGAECAFKLYINGKLEIDQWASTTNNFEADFNSSARYVSLALKENTPLDIKIEFKKRSNRNFIRFEWEIPGNNPIDLAVKAAKESDAVVIFAGLSNFFEGGSNDRKDILLPGEQNKLINEVVKANPNTVVVLINGSPIGMPWVKDVNAIVEAYYPGQEGGNAIANVLFGKVNPSGKLPETFPIKISDNPAYGNYPGVNNVVNYTEGIYVGYRHYDTRNIEPLFPFGYGLSYTTFEYSNLKLKKKGKLLTASFEIKNTGKIAGAEVAQFYIHDLISSEDRPIRELKNFEKTFLQPGETKTITFPITDEDLSFFSAKQNKWVVEPGQFEVQIGSSSKDIRLKKIFAK
ncbi:MAG: glycoside hydrolase family 3 C-terminal domain-containing protein [Sulfuricurvum sp.]|nr:glycoside hydrolase family 3 C-terminal domain-containing protein [Sulfuricurvum sp.]